MSFATSIVYRTLRTVRVGNIKLFHPRSDGHGESCRPPTYEQHTSAFAHVVSSDRVCSVYRNAYWLDVETPVKVSPISTVSPTVRSRGAQCLQPPNAAA